MGTNERYHHITFKGSPLCKAEGIKADGIGCNYLTRTRAKSALLRLIEANPMVSVCGYKIEPGSCYSQEPGRVGR